MTREFEESNYRVNLDYTPTDNALWYLSVTTGHRAGGFNCVISLRSLVMILKL